MIYSDVVIPNQLQTIKVVIKSFIKIYELQIRVGDIKVGTSLQQLSVDLNFLLKLCYLILSYF